MKPNTNINFDTLRVLAEYIYTSFGNLICMLLAYLIRTKLVHHNFFPIASVVECST